MKHLRQISDYAVVGSLGALIVLGLQGCGGGDSSSSAKPQGESMAQIKEKKGALVIIEEQAGGGYKILEEHPSETTRILLKSPDGTERMLSQEEVDKLIKEEAAKIEQGTSNLTNPLGGGLSLGETILASAAGAMLGSWIGSKLFNNQNYQAQQRTTYKSPQAYERSQNSFKSNAAGAGAKATTSTSPAKSTGAPASAKGGFFGDKSSPAASGTNTPSHGG